MLTRKKRYANTAARRVVPRLGSGNSVTTATPINLLTAVIADPTHLTLTYDQDVTMHLPTSMIITTATDPIQFTAFGKIAPNVIFATHETGVPTGLVVPFEDPAVRNRSGGFVLPKTIAIPGP